MPTKINKNIIGKLSDYTKDWNWFELNENPEDSDLSLLELELPKCPIETECFAKARKEAAERYPGDKRTDEEVQEDISRYVQDVSRRLMQARLGVKLDRNAKWRFLEEYLLQSDTKHVVPKNKNLQMDKQANVITLTGLKLFYPKVGETIVGTLEVHANGFIFYATSSPNFRFHFLYTNVKKAFFRVEDEKRPPLLHFHLYHPIKVGAVERQDIQFHLLERRCYDDDSDKIVGRNENLKNFVRKVIAHKVEAKWSHVPVISCCYPFAGAELHKEDEFQGKLPSKASTIFALNSFSLVGIVDEPYLVVHLLDIEIVNLTKLKTGKVDMTVVFRDFKRDPVQINSIPLDWLDLIRKRFCSGSVKYFENCNEDLDWDYILKERADSPGKFYEEKGWFYYDLEDSKTKDLYRYYYAKPEVRPAADFESEDACGSEDD